MVADVLMRFMVGDLVLNLPRVAIVISEICFSAVVLYVLDNMAVVGCEKSKDRVSDLYEWGWLVFIKPIIRAFSL